MNTSYRLCLKQRTQSVKLVGPAGKGGDPGTGCRRLRRSSLLQGRVMRPSTRSNSREARGGCGRRIAFLSECCAPTVSPNRWHTRHHGGGARTSPVRLGNGVPLPPGVGTPTTIPIPPIRASDYHTRCEQCRGCWRLGSSPKQQIAPGASRLTVRDASMGMGTGTGRRPRRSAEACHRSRRS